jgi:hypothetical protein
MEPSQIDMEPSQIDMEPSQIDMEPAQIGMEPPAQIRGSASADKVLWRLEPTPPRLDLPRTHPADTPATWHRSRDLSSKRQCSSQLSGMATKKGDFNEKSKFLNVRQRKNLSGSATCSNTVNPHCEATPL